MPTCALRTDPQDPGLLCGGGGGPWNSCWETTGTAEWAMLEKITGMQESPLTVATGTHASPAPWSALSLGSLWVAAAGALASVKPAKAEHHADVADEAAPAQVQVEDPRWQSWHELLTSLGPSLLCVS